jgi:sec-independent protein translocase protein TatA
MPTSLIPLFPGMPGGIEMAVVLLIVVLLFGANKLPKLARSSGQAMGEFKKGREEIEDELQDMRDDTIGEDDQSQVGQNTYQDQGQETQNPPQGDQNAPQDGQNTRQQGGRSQGNQRQDNQRQGGQSTSDTSADEWGSASPNRDRETGRR